MRIILQSTNVRRYVSIADRSRAAARRTASRPRSAHGVHGSELAGRVREHPHAMADDDPGTPSSHAAERVLNALLAARFGGGSTPLVRDATTTAFPNLNPVTPHRQIALTLRCHSMSTEVPLKAETLSGS
jgi:hypothetical protein